MAFTLLAEELWIAGRRRRFFRPGREDPAGYYSRRGVKAGGRSAATSGGLSYANRLSPLDV